MPAWLVWVVMCALLPVSVWCFAWLMKGEDEIDAEIEALERKYRPGGGE